MKKQLMIFDFVCLGIGAIFLTFVAILQNCGINITNGSVIGIVITVLLFTLILLSTANVFGFDCTVSNITFKAIIIDHFVIHLLLYAVYGLFREVGKCVEQYNDCILRYYGIKIFLLYFKISNG